ncbi:COR domain-containing protein [uncultured Kordia sp.]|uniref:leucine-rich repeat domain-containing protein n=1 Tax=uncultured Kordia sp. TaxID=507699 RepID=UPI002615482B|nr:COR domain-containing protein [uncultured Kordia sp.]
MKENYNFALRLILNAKRYSRRSLNLSNLNLPTLPKQLFELTKLEELNLNYNRITEIPEAIGKLKSLNHLYLENNQITEIPETIGKLKNLNHLYLENNRIIEIPETIGKLIYLTELYLGSNQITEIPKTIGKLIYLTELYLGSNQITEIPETIGKLTNLTHLYLGGNQITKIPEAIGKLINLESLDLDDNKIETLHTSIGKLTHLKKLELQNNQISKLPESIGNITNLKTFYLYRNQISKLPEAIGKLNNLAEIALNENLFKVGSEVYKLPPKEQIQEILKWQEAQKAGTLQPIHEAKVIFIGESNYGKTHLIEFLKEGEIKREINTTHGIERSQLTVPHPDKNIQLNIWDLGGQEFMRSTHQFFFSERTLYVLVTLARRERKDINPWLKLVNQLANKAPVLVVINKIDLDAQDIDRLSLERDYPNIIGFVRTCIMDCKDGVKAKDTLNLLKKRIKDVVSNKDIMPSVFEQRPPDWFMVKNELEKLEAKGEDFITYSEYEKLDFIKNLPEEERKSNLKLLSMIGAVVSFVDDPRLIDTNVINPQWIMDGVYSIINDSKVKDEAKGQLHINDLERILPKDRFPTERHAYLLELMNKFNLCYPAKEQRDIYFIPDLFDDIEPEFMEWKNDASIHFRYNYDDFSPDAFMTQFIVEMHQDIQEDKLWRSGVYISNGNCQAKVYQAFRKNFIHIEIRGNANEGRSYLYSIREAFRKLHKPFPKMHITEEVLYKNYWLDYEELTILEDANQPKYHTKLKEQLPITTILNGYTTMAERTGNLKIIKIFLASSYELKPEREQFEIFINRENKRLIEKGTFLKLEIWEDFIDAMSQTRLQNEYNYVVQNSDIFISLFFTKVGQFTLEEFETAFGQFQVTGKPFVYTYFKDAPVSMEDIKKNDFESLQNFKDKLKNLGHFRTIFKSNEDLQLKFKKQLDKVLPLLS